MRRVSKTYEPRRAAISYQHEVNYDSNITAKQYLASLAYKNRTYKNWLGTNENMNNPPITSVVRNCNSG